MDEAMIKRVPPHSTEAEHSVIGSMMMDREAIVTASEILTPEDFYDKTMGTYFKALTGLMSENVEADFVTVQERMRGLQVPEELCSLEYIGNLLDSVPSAANVKYYAEIVREKARLRKFIKSAEEMTGSAYMDKEDAGALFERAEKEFFTIFQEGGSAEITPINEVAVKAIENIEAAYRNKGTVTGIATGFIDLDYKTAGLQPSDLILIAARPSMGKTAFVLNLADNIAVKHHIPTAIFSLEMNAVSLVNRLLAMQSSVDAQKIRTGNLEDSEWDTLVQSARIIGDSALMIDDTPAISPQELRSKCRKMKLENNLQLVIIDYLQLMSGGKRSESRQQEVSEISRSLKALAREINCPVIALSQLSRKVEERDDKRPILSDLRDSGAIEQDADLVMFLYRDDYYHKDSPKQGITEVIIGKQRNGPIGNIELGFQSNLTRFVNLERTKKRD
ncbi:MAG: replicative DNA helicase [Lachnospiraceae bacterium]|nr:replicative DNA helicase [Lachnospiraceae bacterium]MBO4670187.1 replicative DNA helicase [Lachnospiraceae bacterium]MBR5667891.1 replicative DNA helicase [Lachnospiraceae bacterium]